MTRRKKNMGDWGEEQACRFLQRHGFVIKDRNYYTTFGEIDIVAQKGDDLYFVEVKTRQKGGLSDSSQITYYKKKKLEKTVKIYCFRKKIVDVSIIPAGLMLVLDKAKHSLKFDFCVLY